MSEIRVKIYHDSSPANPATEWGPVPYTIVTRGDYGGGHEYTRATMHEYMRDVRGVVATFGAWHRDHGWMHVEDDPRPGDFRLDSFAYVTKDHVRAEYGDASPENIGRAIDFARAAYREWCDWAVGNVYGYVVERVSTCDCCKQEVVDDHDSCWGFIGSDPERSGLLEAIAEAAPEAAALARAAFDNGDIIYS